MFNSSTYASLIKENEQEIREYKKNSLYKSSDINDERIKFLEDQNNQLKSLVASCKSIQEIKNDKEKAARDKDKEIKEIKKSIREKRKSLSRNGHYKEVLSALVGQVDKRITNFLYKDSTIFEYREKKYKKRYENLFGYTTPRILLSVLLAFLGSYTATPVAAFLGIFCGAVTISKTAATIVNTKVYGDSALPQKREINSGSYLENIKNSVFKFKKSLMKNGNSKYISNVDTSKDESKEVKVEEPASSLENVNVKNFTNLVSNVDLSSISAMDVYKCCATYSRLTEEEKALVSKTVMEKYQAITESEKKKEEEVVVSHEETSLDKLQRMVNTINLVDFDVELANECINYYNSLSTEEKKKVDKETLDKLKNVSNAFGSVVKMHVKKVSTSIKNIDLGILIKAYSVNYNVEDLEGIVGSLHNTKNALIEYNKLMDIEKQMLDKTLVEKMKFVENIFALQNNRLTSIRADLYSSDKGLVANCNFYANNGKKVGSSGAFLLGINNIETTGNNFEDVVVQKIAEKYPTIKKITINLKKQLKNSESKSR